MPKLLTQYLAIILFGLGYADASAAEDGVHGFAFVEEPELEIEVRDDQHAAKDISAPEGFQYIRPGSFVMGSPMDELGRSFGEDQHEVTLTRGFFLAIHPVTETLWGEIMGGRSSSNRPKVEVSWIGAIEFCNALSRREGLTPAYSGSGAHWFWNESADGYRLPTEAEWEYACRAGHSSALSYGPLTHTGCDDPLLERLGWYCGNSDERLQEVGLKVPNEWGLYDMLGNVWEWCWDIWGDYSLLPVTDPDGAPHGSYRLLRGGSFRDAASSCRCAHRVGFVLPHVQQDNIGFRLARTVHPVGKQP